MRRVCLFAIAMTACTPQSPATTAPAPIVLSLGEIDTDAAGRCFAYAAAPTQTNIVSELIQVVPEDRATDGTVRNPAVFRTVTRPKTVTTGQGQRFETVCPPIYTEAFVASLQRALLIRRAYAGPISGQYDAPTNLAVQSFQRDAGIDSPLLAVETARTLGILAVTRA